MLRGVTRNIAPILRLKPCDEDAKRVGGIQGLDSGDHVIRYHSVKYRSGSFIFEGDSFEKSKRGFWELVPPMCHRESFV